jgi:hypothetical protein
LSFASAAKLAQRLYRGVWAEALAESSIGSRAAVALEGALHTVDRFHATRLPGARPRNRVSGPGYLNAFGAFAPGRGRRFVPTLIKAGSGAKADWSDSEATARSTSRPTLAPPGTSRSSR